jgi:hypothetical protein
MKVQIVGHLTERLEISLDYIDSHETDEFFQIVWVPFSPTNYNASWKQKWDIQHTLIE